MKAAVNSLPCPGYFITFQTDVLSVGMQEGFLQLAGNTQHVTAGSQQQMAECACSGPD
jgi:hypothetical protein